MFSIDLNLCLTWTWLPLEVSLDNVEETAFEVVVLRVPHIFLAPTTLFGRGGTRIVFPRGILILLGTSLIVSFFSGPSVTLSIGSPCRYLSW